MEFIHSLPAGTLLQGNAYRYRIERTLGYGSFGITYLATGYVTVQGSLGKVETKIPVAIKEFFMREFSTREATGSVGETTQGSLVQKYAHKFSVEARNLSHLQHPGIVSVLDFIEANRTFYYVMEYIEGGSLDDYLHKHGAMSELEAVDGIRQIGEALAFMHAHKMLHLDLKPKNVMRRPDGHLLLIDFGLSKQYDEHGEPESSTTVGLGTPGYAPIEQADVHVGRDFAPTLDVYALGATFFKMLTGETPPKASDVINHGLPLDKLRRRGVSESVIAALEGAMQFRRTDRTQKVETFLSMLGSTSASAADSELTQVKVENTEVLVSTPEPTKSSCSQEEALYAGSPLNKSHAGPSGTGEGKKKSSFWKSPLWLIVFFCLGFAFIYMVMPRGQRIDPEMEDSLYVDSSFVEEPADILDAEVPVAEEESIPSRQEHSKSKRAISPVSVKNTYRAKENQGDDNMNSGESKNQGNGNDMNSPNDNKRKLDGLSGRGGSV